MSRVVERRIPQCGRGRDTRLEVVGGAGGGGAAAQPSYVDMCPAADPVADNISQSVSNVQAGTILINSNRNDRGTLLVIDRDR